MAFDFPSTPAPGDIIANGSARYEFDGYKWTFAGSFASTLPPSLLENNGGVLVVNDVSWPDSDVGLAVGALWSNAGEVDVVMPTSPDPTAPPVFFGAITSVDLLALGGMDLPLDSPPAGSGQLWNNGGVVCVA